MGLNIQYMKKIIMSLLFCLVAAAALQAQIRKIPSDVTNAFKTMYPKAADVEWKDRLAYFEAQFEDNGSNMTVDFNNKGKWQKTEKALSQEEVPAAVMNGFKKSKYASPDDWKMGDVITMVTKDDKSTEYRIYVDKVDGLQKKYLFFSPSGQLKKEALTL